MEDALVVSCGPRGGVAAPSQLMKDLVSARVESVVQLKRMISSRFIPAQRLGVDGAAVDLCWLVGAVAAGCGELEEAVKV